MKNKNLVNKNIFNFKLGMLLGTLDDFLLRVRAGEQTDGDIDRVDGLKVDLKKRFFELQSEDDSDEK